MKNTMKNVETKKMETTYVGNCTVDNQMLTLAMWKEKNYCGKVQREQRCKVCLKSKKLQGS